MGAGLAVVFFDGSSAYGANRPERGIQKMGWNARGQGGAGRCQGRGGVFCRSRGEFLEFALQGSARDIEQAGSFRDISTASPEDSLDVFPFGFSE